MNEFAGSFPIMVASIYLVCGGMRLARFNCIATYGEETSGHFKGFPIPAAAGLISALTLFVLWVSETEKDLSRLKIIFLILMLFLSYLMLSSIRYPVRTSHGLAPLPRLLLRCILLLHLINSLKIRLRPAMRVSLMLCFRMPRV